MTKIKTMLKIILSIPKTIYFNFMVFDLKTALKLPVLITNNVNILEIHRKSILIESNNIKPFMIIIGLSGSDAINSIRGKIKITKGARLVFEGTARFAEGITLYNNGGTTYFGNNFIANKNCFISTDYIIKFGKDVLLGWNVSIRDSDGHSIIYDGQKKSNKKNINIGNHVWICAYVDVLKGCNIGNDNVIGYKSLVSGLTTQNNVLITGCPARIKKDYISWEK